MEENENIVIDFSDVVTELQVIQQQNDDFLTETRKTLAGQTILLMFVVVLVVYRIRDVFLSFVKKGGMRNDV